MSCELPIKKWTLAGRHSGFPECCIKWFCGKYGRATRTSSRRYQRLLKYRHELERYLWQPGYIPCPVCVRHKRLVYIHWCDTACMGIAGASV